MLYADCLIDMHLAGTANGTLLSSALLVGVAPLQGAAQIGETAGFDSSPITSTSITVQAGQRDLRDDLTIRGLGVFPRSVKTRSIQQNNSVPSEYILPWFDTSLSTGGETAISAGFWFKTTVTNAGVANQLYDFFGFFAVSGGFAMFQLKNGGAPTTSGYGFNIETVVGAVTTHSAYIDGTPGAVYWVSLAASFPAYLATGKGIAQLAMFDEGENLVGQVVTTLDVDTTVQNIRIGNNQSGNQGGTTWFDKVLVDYRQAIFPLGPSNRSNPQLTPSQRAA